MLLSAEADEQMQDRCIDGPGEAIRSSNQPTLTETDREKRGGETQETRGETVDLNINPFLVCF